MNSFLKGALTGTMGAADKYGQIQDEQRKFQTDQTKAQAADMRKRRFAEYDYELKDSFSGSGQMKDGVELSKREAKGQPEGALESKVAYTERMKVDAEQKQLDKTIAAEDRGTERQVEGEIRRGKLSEDLQDKRDVKAEERETKKTKAQQKKTDAKFISDFEKDVIQMKGKVEGAVEKHQAVGDIMDAYKDDPRLADNKAVADYIDTENIADAILANKEAGLNRKKTIAKLKSKGLSEKKINVAMQVLATQVEDLTSGFGW